MQRRATKSILESEDDKDTRNSRLNFCPWTIDDFFSMRYFFYKVLNGYVDTDISSALQLYSDTARHPLREKDGLTLVDPNPRQSPTGLPRAEGECNRN